MSRAKYLPFAPLAKDQIPLQPPTQAYRLDQSDDQELRSQLAEKCKEQALIDVTGLFDPKKPEKGVYYARLFLVHQKGKARLITDSTPINQFLESPSFRMDTVKTLKEIVSSGKFRFGGSMDIKSAFTHLGIKTEDENLLLWLGPDEKVYLPLAAFFGLRPIPLLWTKVPCVLKSSVHFPYTICIVF